MLFGSLKAKVVTSVVTLVVLGGIGGGTYIYINHQNQVIEDQKVEEVDNTVTTGKAEEEVKAKATLSEDKVAEEAKTNDIKKGKTEEEVAQVEIKDVAAAQEKRKEVEKTNASTEPDSHTETPKPVAEAPKPASKPTQNYDDKLDIAKPIGESKWSWHEGHSKYDVAPHNLSTYKGSKYYDLTKITQYIGFGYIDENKAKSILLNKYVDGKYKITEVKVQTKLMDWKEVLDDNKSAGKQYLERMENDGFWSDKSSCNVYYDYTSVFIEQGCLLNSDIEKLRVIRLIVGFSPIQQ